MSDQARLQCALSLAQHGERTKIDVENVLGSLVLRAHEAEQEVERLERIGRRADIAEAAVSRAYRLLSNVTPGSRDESVARWAKEALEVLRVAQSKPDEEMRGS